MLKHIAFFIAPFVLILACKTLKKSDTEKKSNQSILFSSIKREYCFGNCPVYELKIFKNGDAIYHGIANTKLQGWYCSKLDKTVLDRLSEKWRSKYDLCSLRGGFVSCDWQKLAFLKNRLKNATILQLLFSKNPFVGR